MNDNDKKLLNILKEARLDEEKVIPLYAKHLSSAAFWTGLPDEKIEKAKEIMGRLIKESEAHKVAVEGLIERLGKR